MTGLPATNNGNVWGQKVNGVPRSYTYDGFNRLTSASQGGGQSYTYDTRGNRAATGAGTNSLEVPTNYTAYSSDNRNSSWDYDGSGNVIRIPSTSLGPVIRSATYDYDGDGRRVKKTVTPSGAAAITTVFVYDPMGELAAEFGSTNDAGTRYLTADHLGSTRLITKQDGSVDKTYDYLPFGEEYSTTSPIYPQLGGPNSIKFTSKERDAETGLDFFEARYYSSAQGRFTSPDEFKGGFLDAFSGQSAFQPGPLPYADISDPQTLNKFAYVRNNPLRYTDPNGHCIEDFCIGEAILLGALGGGVGGTLVQKVSDFFTGHDSSLRELGAAFVGGAIIGGTGGAAAPLSIPLEVAAVGSAGMVGGVAQRAISTGSMNETTKNPGDLGKDFVAAATVNRGANLVTTAATGSERGAVAELSRQQGRTTTTSSFQKITARLQNANGRLSQKAAATSAAAATATDALRTGIEKQKHKNCSSELEGCR